MLDERLIVDGDLKYSWMGRWLHSRGRISITSLVLTTHFKLQRDKVNSFLMINMTRTRICEAVDIVDERSSFALLTG